LSSSAPPFTCHQAHPLSLVVKRTRVFFFSCHPAHPVGLPGLSDSSLSWRLAFAFHTHTSLARSNCLWYRLTIQPNPTPANDMTLAVPQTLIGTDEFKRALLERTHRSLAIAPALRSFESCIVLKCLNCGWRQLLSDKPVFGVRPWVEGHAHPFDEEPHLAFTVLRLTIN
jgi:hypothetical protein